MNIQIKKSDKFNVVAIVLTNNPEPLEGFTEIIDAKEMFISKKTRISELLTTLNKPHTEVYGVKMDSRHKLRSLLKLAIGTGITVAGRQKNQPLLLTLKNYRKILSKTNTHDLPDMATRVCTELEQYQTMAASAGLTAEKLTELKGLTTSFREIIEGTDYEFNTRKAARKELKGLITDCINILNNEIVPYVEHCKESFPDFYNAFTAAYSKKKYSRKKGVAVNAEPANITGTVTDSVTNEPVEGAIINLIETETVAITDEDGYYEIEEVAVANYTLGCHAPGYLVPESVKADPKAGESLVIDFILVPEPVTVPVE
jgi:hypothetical protein